MPWKNPRCPKCKSHTKQIKFLEVTRKGNDYNRDIEYGKAIFKCKWCGHEFKDWGHRKCVT